MPKQVRVNIRAAANMAAVRKEKRNGRDVVIVPSATLPDDIVMNEILYPADEIERAFGSLNGTPAPFGHPLVNGRFVSACDPEGINRSWVGAWNENVRREPAANGKNRVMLDKIIDVEVARRSEDGTAVLNAIDKGEPVHTSTGLLCELEDANGDVTYKHIARNMEFDHDAILLGEEGAATPADGVGMMVNAKGEEIEVINSAIEDAERDLDWAADMAARAVERMERAPLLERIKSAIMEAVSGGTSEREPSANRKEADMADDKQLDALSAKVNAIEESLKPENLSKALGETVTNAVTEAVKPLKEHVDKIEANQKAKDEAEHAELVAKVVKANILDEDSAKELTLNALRKLAEKAKPGKAAALNGAFGGSDDDHWAGYNVNAHAVTGEKKEAQ